MIIKSIYFLEKGQTYQKPAFLATLNPRLMELTSSNSVVKFDNIITNIGSGYNAKSGVFTAPREGTYTFAVNYVHSGKKEWLELDLMKNNSLVVRGNAAFDPHTSGSILAILELKKGDRISVLQPRASGTILGERYSMFSGHLI